MTPPRPKPIRKCHAAGLEGQDPRSLIISRISSDNIVQLNLMFIWTEIYRGELSCVCYGHEGVHSQQGYLNSESFVKLRWEPVTRARVKREPIPHSRQSKFLL